MNTPLEEDVETARDLVRTWRNLHDSTDDALVGLVAQAIADAYDEGRADCEHQR
jgi:hypothetical protein